MLQPIINTKELDRLQEVWGQLPGEGPAVIGRLIGQCRLLVEILDDLNRTRRGPAPAAIEGAMLDRFAAAALTGLLANPKPYDQGPPPEDFASDAYIYASHLLAARARQARGGPAPEAKPAPPTEAAPALSVELRRCAGCVTFMDADGDYCHIEEGQRPDGASLLLKPSMSFTALSQSHVRALLPLLRHFAETGRLPQPGGAPS